MEAIVIVVLAMTLLGLGLTFVRNMFKDIGSTTGEVQAQVRDQILGTLRTGTEKLALQSNQVTLETGESKLFAIGVANKEAAEITFTIPQPIVTKSGGSVAPGDLSFFLDQGPYSLKVGESDAYNIRITAGSGSGVKGAYLVKITIKRSTSTMAVTCYDASNNPVDCSTGNPITCFDAANNQVACPAPGLTDIYATKTFFVNVI